MTTMSKRQTAFRADYRYAVVAKSDDDTDRGSTGWLPLRAR